MAEKSQDSSDIELLSVREAAQLLKMSRFTLYYWAAARKIPHFKIGKRVMFSKADLVAWLESHRVDRVE